jgi:hypothetical protein
MTKTSLFCAGVTVLAMAVAIVSASAQFPSPPPPTSPPPPDAPAGTPKKKAPVGAPKKKAAVGAPKATQSQSDITGTWDGELNQVGSTAPYKFELSITAKGAETKYAELDCIGKLTRIGQSKSYVFFIEIITKGQADKGGRCPDGTITVARQGDELAVGWFGSIQDTTVVAYGTLKKR